MLTQGGTSAVTLADRNYLTFCVVVVGLELIPENKSAN